MKFLRSLNYLYLSLLPALTYPTIVMANAEHISGWYNVLFFLTAIIYIPLINYLSPFPKTSLAAIISVILVPTQIWLALYLGNFTTIWPLFAYQFLIEGAGLLIGAVWAGLFGQLGTKQVPIGKYNFHIPTFKQFLSLSVLIVPAFVLVRLFGPMFTGLNWGWPLFFLFTALMTAASKNYVRLLVKNEQPQETTENLPIILIGIFCLFTLGPILGANFDGN